MIRLNIEAETPQEFADNLSALWKLLGSAAYPSTANSERRTPGVDDIPLPATADPAPAKATRTKKSAAGKDESAQSAGQTPSPEPEAQPQPGTDTGTAPATAGSSSTEENAASGGTGASSAGAGASQPATEVTAEALRAKAAEFGMKNEPGLKELLTQFGTNGKFSGVPVENYGPMMIRLEELLAGSEG